MLSSARLEDRFWSKVEKTDSCWLWLAGKLRQGYGMFHVRARTPMQLAHRVAWELQHGGIPDGLCVLHRCDVPRCVNPAHLFLGTTADNTRDMVNKGRDRKAVGERHGMSKLTEVDVREIRSLYAGGGWTKAALGVRYGVSSVNICDVVAGVGWKHVPC